MAGCAKNHLSRFGGMAPGREDEQKRYFREKRLYSIQIESIDACEQACLYCYAGSSPKQKLGLTTEEILGLINDLSELEIRAIDWLGGDPLLRPDWYSLMQYAKSKGMVNNLWTSGIPLCNDRIADQVLEMTEGGFVSVHVDSIDPSIYEKLHPQGNIKNIDRIIRGVDNLLSKGKSPDSMFNCITYTSIQSIENVIETMDWFFTSKGLRTCLTMFNPSGAAASLRHLEPRPDKLKEVYSARDRINYGDDNISISAMDVDKYYCGTVATVTITGDITPCSVIREGVGNIRNTPFRQIVKDHLGTLIHGDLHDAANLPDSCVSCNQNSNCWGCRASAYNYNGDANGSDPKCIYNYAMQDI